MAEKVKAAGKSKAKKIIAREGLIAVGILLVQAILAVVWNYETVNRVPFNEIFLFLMLTYPLYVLIRCTSADHEVFKTWGFKNLIGREIGVIVYLCIVFWLMLCMYNDFHFRIAVRFPYGVKIGGNLLFYNAIGIIMFMYYVPFLVIRFIAWAIKTLREKK